MKKLFLVVLLLSVTAFVGCGGSSSSVGNTPPPVTLQSIQVTPATPSIAAGATQQFTATGTYSDGSTKNLTSTANWLSSSVSVATITTSGLVTGLGGGTTTISASSGGITGTATLTVVALQSITVTPPTATVAPNGTQQYTATGNYSDGTTKDLTSSVSWSATAGATITAGGLAKGVTAGATATIAAAAVHPQIVGFATLTVTNPLVSIAVTPNPVSVSPVAPNNTQQFTATGTYADGSTQNITGSVTWSASVGATITSGGLATAVTPNSTVTIMATQGNISGTAIMTVTNPLVSIAVTPPAPQIAAGTAQQFVATGTYADNSTQVLTSTVTWASSNTAFATISNTQGSQGLATGVAAGTVQITATSGSIVGTTTLKVTSSTLVSIAVTPVAPVIVYQTQQQFTATGTFSDSSTQDITNTVTWFSSDTAHISITPTGLATGVATISTGVIIKASQNGVNGSTTATVVPATITSIAITPNSSPTYTNLAVGTSRQYTATATLTNGSTANYTSLVSWNSDNSAATVGLHSGLVKGISAGNANITAAYNGVTSPALNLSVNAANVLSITVTPIKATMPVGVTQRFSATAVFDNSPTQDITMDAAWASSAPAVATIISPGVASSVGGTPGTTNITATFGGVPSSAAVLTVDSSTLSSISISPPSTVLPAGKTINYNAYGTYQPDGLTFVLTGLPNLVWTSSDTSLVSINSSGTANTLLPGPPVTITATYQNVTSNNATVIVTQFPLQSIAVSPATATVPVGVSTPFTALGTFSDSHTHTQDLTSYATWAANPSSVATINSGSAQPGVSTGLTPGQASVTAVFAGVVSNNASLTVSSATIQSLTVTPNPASAAHGSQVQFRAVGHFSDTSNIDLTNQVVWTSSDTTVATINGTGIASIAGASGKTAQIKATFTQNGVPVSGTSTLTVQ